jgi:hypothetical protein
VTSLFAESINDEQFELTQMFEVRNSTPKTPNGERRPGLQIVDAYRTNHRYTVQQPAILGAMTAHAHDRMNARRTFQGKCPTKLARRWRSTLHGSALPSATNLEPRRPVRHIVIRKNS